VPLAIQPAHERRREEEEAHGDDQSRRDPLEELAVGIEGLTEARRGEAEDDEDR
jgi:hypothetical protein